MWQHPTTRVHRLTRGPTRFLYRHADAVLTYGRHVSRFVEAEGADPSRVLVAPQAVDLTRFTPGDRAMRPGHVLRVGYVGRLEAWKGPLVLIEALAELKGMGVAFEARLAGSGPEERQCLDAVASADLSDSVQLVGQIDNDALPAFYRCLDAVVIPSVPTGEVTEVWSLVVNEAMGCGCLVIASDAVGAAADGLVTDGQTGCVVPAGDASALARVLAAAAADPGRTARLSSAGQAAVQAYTFDAAAEAFRTAVDIAENRRRRRSGQGGR
jgi:glycosyltransferase involved in cell wall biosynthesis